MQGGTAAAHLVKVNFLEARKQQGQALHHQQLPVPHMLLAVVWPNSELQNHHVKSPLPALAHHAPCNASYSNEDEGSLNPTHPYTTLCAHAEKRNWQNEIHRATHHANPAYLF